MKFVNGVEPRVAFTIIAGDLRIVDDSDDSAPLIDITFHNECAVAWAKMSEDQRLEMGERVMDALIGCRDYRHTKECRCWVKRKYASPVPSPPTHPD
jgi:hypothetical protein